MAKFKVGDRVRVVWTNDIDTYSVGDVGEVVDEIFPGFFRVEFEDYLSEYVTEEQVDLISEDIQNWWETSEGIEWLSTQQGVEEQFLKSQEKREEKTYRAGQRFSVFYYDMEYTCILAQVGPDEVCLINLGSGNRFNEPIPVLDSRKITEDEMKMIAEGWTFQPL